MSIKGRPYAWFRAALSAGDLPQIRSAVAELRWVNLSDALEVLEVIAQKEPELYERAACRWLARYAAERQVGLDDIGRALAALARLADGSQRAEVTLAGLVAPAGGAGS